MADASDYTGIRLWIVTGREKVVEESEEEQKRQLIGNVLHKAIELLLKYAPYNSENLVDFAERSIQAAWAILSRDREVPDYTEKESLEIQQEAKEILEKALSHEEISNLLRDGEDDTTVRSEVEIIDERSRTFRIDLMRIKPSLKSIEVVDFKTHRIDPEKTRNQLTQYVRIVKRAFGPSWEVKGIVAYLDPPKVEEVL
ncbi:MAG: PD-(D/E)XK nuclease family protein [Thermodesulforhabdaceae bacterium]